MVAGGDRAVLGPQDRGDDFIGCARSCRVIDGADVEDVVVDDHTVGLLDLTRHAARFSDPAELTPHAVEAAPPTKEFRCAAMRVGV